MEPSQPVPDEFKVWVMQVKPFLKITVGQEVQVSTVEMQVAQVQNNQSRLSEWCLR